MHRLVVVAGIARVGSAASAAPMAITGTVTGAQSRWSEDGTQLVQRHVEPGGVDL